MSSDVPRADISSEPSRLLPGLLQSAKKSSERAFDLVELARAGPCAARTAEEEALDELERWLSPLARISQTYH
jgi:hypothetical protein